MAAAKQVASARALGVAGRGPVVGWNGSRTVRAPGRNVPSDLKTVEALRRLSVRVAAVEGSADPDAAELAQLREENAALRATLAERLDAVDAALLAEYDALRARAAAVGERIPSLTDGDDIIEVAAPEPEAPAPEEPAAPGPDGVIVEADAEGAVVFKFGGVSNSGRASAMAVPKSGDDDGAVVFSFGEKGETTAAAAVAAPKAAAAAAAPASAAAAAAAFESGSSGSESDTEGKPRRRRRTTTAAAGSGTAAAPKKRAPRAKKADPFAAARAAAEKEVAAADPATALAGKADWLYATVPETPVAGAPLTLYFNRAVSEALRHRPRVQLQARFNNWELAGEEERVEMVQATGEWFSATLTAPADAYEINFIFGDSEVVYDNAGGANYCLPVSGPMTREAWVDSAPERAEAAFLARKAAEAAAAEAAAAEREAAALEADKAAAAAAVEEIKRSYEGWRAGGEASDRWKYDATKGLLSYNPVGGPLADIPVPEDQVLTLKLGHNGWKGARDVAMRRGKGGWWEAPLGSLPREAVALNFVVQYYEHFDNNGGADFAVALPAPATDVAAWADALLPALTADTTAARHAAEAAAAAAEAARAAARLAVRQKAEEVRRRQGRHVLFTEPAEPQAGKTVTIAYNPNNTVLHGAERVFLRGGFNRWRHPKGYGPIEMTPPADAASQHFTATVTVPKDAYSLDFVFSDAEEHGRYDNAGGLDYHLPVTGAVVEEPPLYVVHVAAEMAPIAKVGGLGDVVTALGRAVQEVGHTVEVILPRYDFFLQSPLLGGTQYETEFEWEGTRIFVSTCVVEGLRCWFIEPGNGMFATQSVYQGATDAARFSYFSRAALEFLLRTQRQPDILHCHDWSSAEVAKAYWTEYHAYGLWRPKVVFTIHNLNYGAAAIGDAAYFSQRFTTVSPSYAGEIGGHPAVAPHSGKLMGIRNGIDVDIWNPETDQFLPVGYNAESCEAGKAAAREELRRRLGLTGWGDKPLVGVVTRLTKQKGTHLIAHAAWRTLDRGGQFVLLGSAPDPKVQAEFDALAGSCGGENAAFCFAFDEPLSHLIYAACDMILVPSMFEPCGLTQMIAMRYGAVPVVRSTGGLHDTVFDVDTDKARAAWEMEGSTNFVEDDVDATNGFSFEGTDEGALDYALNRALDAWYNDRPWFRSLQRRVMGQDWSWNRPALEYVQLYYAALK